MVNVIVLSDQKVEMIFQPRDFGYLIERYMGYDAETYFRETVEKLQKDADYTTAKVETDLGAYEASLESNTACFQEILELVDQMKSILEAPRINKNQMFKLVEQVQNEIGNQI